MEIKNCRACGKMFNYMMGEQICPACREAQEVKFQEVKKFVQDNKTATMNEICEQCDVDIKQVKKWVREERLFFTDDSPVKINCESCGVQISTGRFCDKCRKTAASTFDNLVKSGNATRQSRDDGPTTSGTRMFTFRN